MQTVVLSLRKGHNSFERRYQTLDAARRGADLGRQRGWRAAIVAHGTFDQRELPVVVPVLMEHPSVSDQRRDNELRLEFEQADTLAETRQLQAFLERRQAHVAVATEDGVVAFDQPMTVVCGRPRLLDERVTSLLAVMQRSLHRMAAERPSASVRVAWRGPDDGKPGHCRFVFDDQHIEGRWQLLPGAWRLKMGVERIIRKSETEIRKLKLVNIEE